MVKYLIFGLIIAFLLVVFSIQNATSTNIYFFSWHYNGSLVIIVLSAFSIGVLTGVAFMLFSKTKKAAPLPAKGTSASTTSSTMEEDDFYWGTDEK